LSYAAPISHLELTTDAFDDFIRSPFVDERLAGADRIDTVVVRGDNAGIASPGSLPVVVVWVGDEFGGDGPMNADVVVAESDLDGLLTATERAPLAAATLAVLLRSQTTLSVSAGLGAESAAYSVLQSGPEFAAWRAAASAAPDSTPGAVVAVERDGSTLVIILDRPHRHNAISMQLRDELYAALSIAVVDNSIRAVALLGNGPSFCSGGDLGEFGSRPDPAQAHVTRLARSPGRLIHELGQRAEVRRVTGQEGDLAAAEDAGDDLRRLTGEEDLLR
jgi:hypothetical protein